jgi:hypothetical protein
MKLVIRGFFAVGLATWVAFFGGTGLAQSIPSPKPFLVLDGTMYRNKPDLSQFGIQPINVVYESRIFEKGTPADNLPSKARVQQIVRELGTSHWLVMDIERWRLHGTDQQVADQVRKYVTVMEWIHEAMPGITAGIFGKTPIEDYDRSTMLPGSGGYRGWQAENDRIIPLAQSVDALFPTIYTYYTDQQGWVKFATENMKEAKRYGKKSYVFIWPQYSESNPLLAHQYLPPDFWKLQLETVLQNADGVVIWGGWDGVKSDFIEWDENAPWWKITKEFMKTLTQAHPAAPRTLTIQ